MNKIKNKNLEYIMRFILWTLFFPVATAMSSLHTDLIIAPPSPVLITPANGSTSNLLNPLLDWEEINCAIRYDVQVATDDKFTNIVSEGTNLLSSQYGVPIGHLAHGTTFYWRVIAMDSIGAGAWSAVWNFTTVPGESPTLVLPEDKIERH